jgi:hypothetical protein
VRCKIGHGLVTRGRPDGVLYALRTVDGHGMGVGWFIRLVEPVADLLVLVQQDAQRRVGERGRGDLANHPLKTPSVTSQLVTAAVGEPDGLPPA